MWNMLLFIILLIISTWPFTFFIESTSSCTTSIGSSSFWTSAVESSSDSTKTERQAAVAMRKQIKLQNVLLVC